MGTSHVQTRASTMRVDDWRDRGPLPDKNFRFGHARSATSLAHINCETNAAATVPTALASVGAPRLEQRLQDEHRVEIPVLVWHDRPCLQLPAVGPARQARHEP